MSDITTTFMTWCMPDIEYEDFIKGIPDYVKTDVKQYLDYKLFIKLNTLCQTYHSAFGYFLGDKLCEEDYNETYHLFSAITGLFLGEETEGDDSVTFQLDLKVAEAESKMETFPHRKVILRLNGGWYEKPSKVKKTMFSEELTGVEKARYWYNLSLEPNPKLYGLAKNRPFVEPLSTRTYIKVINPFEEIVIDSEKKNKPITFDDVFFATRGLCKDDTRSIEQYQVLSDDGSTLVLMPNIDNYST